MEEFHKYRKLFRLKTLNFEAERHLGKLKLVRKEEQHAREIHGGNAPRKL